MAIVINHDRILLRQSIEKRKTIGLSSQLYAEHPVDK